MYRLILLLCATGLLMCNLSAQSFDSLLSAYNSKYPQEKIHIHFDKDTYLPGETIWMKAYLLSDGRPSTVSKNLYFDWTDADGRLFLHSVSPISEGGASSFFKLPSWVKNGVMHVKVYTEWMLNFDNAYLFNKDIPVLMPAEGAIPVQEKLQTTISFFPEGGELINGVTSVLAFEALNQHNKPSTVSGVIKSAKNIIIDSFHTIYNGMGTLRFKPVSGEHYIAYWNDESGELHTTPLPDAKANGLVLQVDPYNNDQLHYRLEKSADASKLTKIIVIGTIDQKVVYRNSLILLNNMAEANINATGFPCGVLQLTAFDAELFPLAERVAFINNQKAYAKVQMKKESVSLNKRSRNEISIEIPDSMVTNLSVSVTDAGLGYDSSNNIYSDFLIAGDLKGVIADAASLLTNPANANEHLNLLLLTHGWRKFNWETVVSGEFPELKYPRDAGFLSIKGEIKNGTNLDNQDSMALLLVSRDRKKNLLKLPVNEDGKFGQNGLFFYDSVQVVYKFNHVAKLNNNSQISLYSDLLPALTPAKADEPSFSWMKVPDVILEKEMNGNLIEIKDNSTPSPAMSYVVTPQIDSLGKNSESAAHYLNTMFVDLRFPATLKENAPLGDGRLAAYNYKANSFAIRSNVNVTLDGSPVAMDDLKSVNMKEVLFIKFLPKTNQKSLPTLAITSRQALDQANILDNKTGFAVIKGYTPVREFYQQKYDENKTDDYEATDFRSTLYWNPKLRLDKSHRKMSFVFYNNDISNKFRIVVEGMNQDGKLCRIEEIIK
ncbi:MAG TPA: hypothetical protein VK711_01160 [Puia sp.]|jgi:hypothetical protein|nr:hypothetical protein [Puia sp.]